VLAMLARRGTLRVFLVGCPPLSSPSLRDGLGVARSGRESGLADRTGKLGSWDRRPDHRITLGVECHRVHRYPVPGRAALARFAAQAPWRALPRPLIDFIARGDQRAILPGMTLSRGGVDGAVTMVFIVPVDEAHGFIAAPHRDRQSRQRPGKTPIVKSEGGLSNKVHVLVDALGNPLTIVLTAGQVHELVAADTLVPWMDAEALLADKAYNTDERVIEPLEETGKTAVIRRKNRKNSRTYDKALYEARHLIQNFFRWVRQLRAIAACYDETARNLLAAFHGRRALLAQLTTGLSVF